MNTPFLAMVRATFPGARVAVLGRRHVAALFHNHPNVDEVWEIDDRSRSGYAAAVRRLRTWRADLGFCLPNSLNAAALLAAGGVRERVGYDRDARRLLLTVPVKLRPQDLGVHEVRYYLRLLSPWGVPTGDPPGLALAVSGDEAQEMRAWLGERGLADGQPAIGVNPAALFGTAKRWPADRYARAAGQVAEEVDGRVFVTGLADERGVAEEVCQAGGPRFHNAAGEMTLRGLMAFLGACSLYLTNDSGAMHVAAAMGAPLVAVFGSTDWVTTAPLGEHVRIVRVETPCAPCILRHCPIDHRCMTGVSVDMVAAAAREVYGAARRESVRMRDGR